MSFPILQRIIALLGVQPSTVRPIATPRLVQQTIGKTFHVDPYSFGSEELHLWQDIQQRPFVPSEEKYSFGPESFSASATLRHRRYGKVEKVGPEYFESLPKEKYDFSSSSKRPCLASVQPNVAYEEPTIDFGLGSSRRVKPSETLSEEEKTRALEESRKGPDFGLFDSRPTVREPSPYKTREEMLYGPEGKPQRVFQPTIKSSVNLKKTEKYDFGISF